MAMVTELTWNNIQKEWKYKKLKIAGHQLTCCFIYTAFHC